MLLRPPLLFSLIGSVIELFVDSQAMFNYLKEAKVLKDVFCNTLAL
jgi:hypothetical protein